MCSFRKSDGLGLRSGDSDSEPVVCAVCLCVLSARNIVAVLECDKLPDPVLTRWSRCVGVIIKAPVAVQLVAVEA